VIPCVVWWDNICRHGAWCCPVFPGWGKLVSTSSVT
jgi:hypothetical protein